MRGLSIGQLAALMDAVSLAWHEEETGKLAASPELQTETVACTKASTCTTVLMTTTVLTNTFTSLVLKAVVTGV